MPDFRDFEEPYSVPDHSTDEKSTRWILTACFSILLLAGVAFASIGQIAEPTNNPILAESRQAPPQATIITPTPDGTTRVE
jgi:hypothetical protein